MTYHIGFFNGIGTEKTWYLRPLKDGFKHCFMFQTYDDSKLIIYFENLFAGIDITLLAGTAEDIIDMLKANIGDFTLVAIEEPEAPPRRRKYTPELITCVTTLKRIIGINNRNIRTPYQLYKYLLNNGGWEIKI